MELSIKSLVARLTPTSHKAFELASGVCLVRGNPSLEIEQFLYELCLLADNDVVAIAKSRGIRLDSVRQRLEATVEQFPSGVGVTPTGIAPGLIDTFRLAGMLSRYVFGWPMIRSGAILAASQCLSTTRSQLRKSTKAFESLNRSSLLRDLPQLVATSVESVEMNQSTWDDWSLLSPEDSGASVLGASCDSTLTRGATMMTPPGADVGNLYERFVQSNDAMLDALRSLVAAFGLGTTPTVKNPSDSAVKTGRGAEGLGELLGAIANVETKLAQIGEGLARTRRGAISRGERGKTMASEQYPVREGIRLVASDVEETTRNPTAEGQD